jgi:hypothetical protein
VNSPKPRRWFSHPIFLVPVTAAVTALAIHAPSWIEQSGGSAHRIEIPQGFSIAIVNDAENAADQVALESWSEIPQSPIHDGSYETPVFESSIPPSRPATNTQPVGPAISLPPVSDQPANPGFRPPAMHFTAPDPAFVRTGSLDSADVMQAEIAEVESMLDQVESFVLPIRRFPTNQILE